jgi:uncharacterized membrane protein (UPF0127 family)
MTICVIVFLLSACQAGDRQTITLAKPSGEELTFSVALAMTDEEQQKGLMHIESMADNEGMLFVFEEPRDNPRFWMKNTLIPLDMLFFDERNMLVHIERNVQPHDLTLRGPDKIICSVLELNGGIAKERAIPLGAELITNIHQECLQ